MATGKRVPLGTHDIDIDAARAIARGQIANAKERDRLIAHLDSINGALRSVLDRVERSPDPHYVNAFVSEDVAPVGYEFARLIWELRKEAKRTGAQAARYTEDRRGMPDWLECARDGETVEDATIRVLVERGANPYRIAQALKPGAESATIADSAEKSAAKRTKRDHARDLARQERLLVELLESMDAGHQFYNRWAEVTPERVRGELERVRGMMTAMSA